MKQLTMSALDFWAMLRQSIDFNAKVAFAVGGALPEHDSPALSLDALLDLLRALKARWSEHGMAAPHPVCSHPRCEPRRAARCSPWTHSTTAPASGAARAATCAGFRR